MAQAEGSTSLRSGSIGLWAVAFQSVLFMAPAAAMAFSFGAAIPFAADALALAALGAGIACVLVAVGIGQLAKHMPSAGGLYTYVSKALSPVLGFMVGWWFFLFSLMLGPAILLLGGFVIEDLWVQAGVDGGQFFTKWWFSLAILMVLVAALCIFDVHTSTRVGIILGVAELIVFVALGLTLLGANTDSIGVTPFTPSEVADGQTVANGLFRGMLFAILAFIGFEAAASLGEESKDPRRVVPRAVILAAVAVGIFYVFTTYAWVVGSGNDVTTHYAETGGNDWVAFAREHWGMVWWLVSLALVNSAIACAKATTDTAARVVFSMSRNGALPSFMGKLHPKHQTPYVAVLVGSVIGTVGWIFLADWAGKTPFATELGIPAPLVGYFTAGTFLTVLMVAVYILAAISCAVYMLREQRSSFNPLVHAVLPLLGAAIFVVALYFQFWSDWPWANGVDFWYQPSPFKEAIFAALIAAVSGLAIGVILKGVRKDALDSALDLVTADSTLDSNAGTELPRHA